MAPTEGRFTTPERRWGCRRGTPKPIAAIHLSVTATHR